MRTFASMRLNDKKKHDIQGQQSEMSDSVNFFSELIDDIDLKLIFP